MRIQSSIFKVNRRPMNGNGANKWEIFFGIFFLISVLIKCMYFQYTTHLIVEPVNSQSNRMMLAASLGTLLILAFFIAFFFRKYRTIGLFVLDVLLTTLLISDTVYFRYYTNAITIPVLMQIGLIGPLGESIRTLLKTTDLLYLFDFPFLIAGIVVIAKKGFSILSWKKRGIISLSGIIAGLIIFISVNHQTNTLWFDYDKNYVAKQLGILYFHVFDTQAYLKENVFVNKSVSKKEKETVTQYLQGKKSAGSSFKGIAENKNLVVVQLEAIQQFVINRKIGKNEITPNLNALLKESLYFDNFYYQVGAGNTSDAEFITNNSLYPAKEGAAYFRFPTNTYHALPSLLKQKGYATSSFHAYHASFWNRTVMHKKLGFDRFYSDQDFTPGINIGFGLNDASFLTQSVDMLSTDKPFYGFMITLSSHYAYASFQHDAFPVGEYEGTDLGNYFKAAHYVDESIGELIAALKQKGIYDNTVLVLYGDHFMMPKNNSKEYRDFLGLGNSDLAWTQNEKVPFILHYPGVKNGIIDHTIGGQVDTLPTLANLLGIQVPYALGKDLLNTDKGYAVLRNGSVITDDYIYVNDTKEAYQPTTGEKLQKSAYEASVKQYQHQLEVSDIILQKNAFKVLK